MRPRGHGLITRVRSMAVSFDEGGGAPACRDGRRTQARRASEWQPRTQRPGKHPPVLVPSPRWRVGLVSLLFLASIEGHSCLPGHRQCRDRHLPEGSNMTTFCTSGGRLDVRNPLGMSELRRKNRDTWPPDHQRSPYRRVSRFSPIVLHPVPAGHGFTCAEEEPVTPPATNASSVSGRGKRSRRATGGMSLIHLGDESAAGGCTFAPGQTAGGNGCSSATRFHISS
jgi:hypothetical protein